MKPLPTALSTEPKSLSRRRISCIRVALDVPLAKLFDYALPEDFEVRVGDRVVVPFGARQRIGVVVATEAASELPASRMKSITAVRNDAPRLPSDWLELMRFLSGYYQRPLGETMIAALPPRLRSVRPLPRKSLSAAPLATSPRFVPTHTLTPDQTHAFQRIADVYGRFEAFLLHGVTGSGKTEVYLNLIARVLERGGQALVLVPEISLTPQLESRFRQAFPDARIAVMHSALEDVARTSGWLEAARGEAGIVLGTRLGVLAPLPKLALIVVDEEHDPSFKQQEGLRYSARDAAVYRAKLAGCPVVLGSATPSLESWHNWRSGRYERLELPERASPGARLPAVRTVDLGRESAEQGLAPALWSALAARLQRNEQSLIFINRRGYAPVLACEGCGWTAGCTRCSARMVLHAADRRLRCHHCGAESPIPRACPTCGNVDLQPLGRGTQRIEEALQARFPAARIVRIDRDSARRRGELARTLDRIRRGEGDILVGTQLLAKGHDFPGLTLVGVLNADTALVSTDYRAPERLFAVLAQVAGRAGRRERPGEVLVQTRYPGHPLFGALARHDFAGFADSQLAERRAAGFPPYLFEAALRAEALKLDTTLRFLREAAAMAAVPDEVRVFDPVPNTLTRRAGLERAQLLVQSSSRPALQAFLAELTGKLFVQARRDVRWHLDVDPIEFD
ncbi:MAG: primosomal protein N' [Betaproteobacteria bacterium RIFCSPLOWO2_12_FULL_65_14]|nr:MAG: primosomal protein N' [Betaproteobacteria bacterium RIFCSPLOWO2_12_FULL_65_14]